MAGVIPIGLLARKKGIPEKVNLGGKGGIKGYRGEATGILTKQMGRCRGRWTYQPVE